MTSGLANDNSLDSSAPKQNTLSMANKVWDNRGFFLEEGIFFNKVWVNLLYYSMGYEWHFNDTIHPIHLAFSFSFFYWFFCLGKSWNYDFRGPRDSRVITCFILLTGIEAQRG